MNVQAIPIAIIAGQLVVGGAERQLYLWLSHLDREKFQPIVLTLHPGFGDYWEKPIEALDIPLFHIPHRRNPIARLSHIVRNLQICKPQLVHGWHLFASPYAGAAAKFLGAKSLGGHRGSFRVFHDSPVIAQLTLYLVDALLVNSYSAAKKIRVFSRFRSSQIYTVQNAIEDQINDRLLQRENLSRSYGLPQEDLWIGSLGRLDSKKRFDLLLRVIAVLREDVKGFHFLLIGDGPERLRLEKLAMILGIADCVTFTGEITGASVLLSALDVFCFTSLDEGLPNAVMEAAMAGVPIVSWRMPFIEELLINGKGALLAEPGDSLSFTKHLLNLINSPELRIRMGQDGRAQMLGHFSLDRYVQRMTNVYENLLGVSPFLDKEDA
ncbi:MAG: glycosyltransferase family 4 protein [Anaerolineales bacterium]|jgi:glycosyltransferase involved in cell wall biosynthesis|nr:glycosyltransferase family 4 protein [Anaerolineales bacterium]GER80063.1 glycosyltransferase [Candidatus Denitrolinea symbiosum]